MRDTLNNTGIQHKHYYKVPFGQELPFAGRFLKAIGHSAGCVHFVAANGKLVRLYNPAAEILARTAAVDTVLTPKAFI